MNSVRIYAANKMSDEFGVDLQHVRRGTLARNDPEVIAKPKAQIRKMLKRRRRWIYTVLIYRRRTSETVATMSPTSSFRALGIKRMPSGIV